MSYTARVTKAVECARIVHHDQRRKGADVPYLSHLLAVAALVSEFGGDEDQVIAALLHDSVEDHPDRITFQSIEVEFGPCVAALVAGCCDSTSLPKPPWRRRKEAFIDALAHADAGVRLIVAADKLHNAQTIRRDLRNDPNVWDRFKGGKDGTVWYYRAVLEALGRGWKHPILDALADEVDRLDAAARACP